MGESNDLRDLTASRLRLARQNAGLTQDQVARLLVLPRPSIAEIEAGRRRVAVEELRRFSEIYGVEIAWLAGEGETSANTRRDKVHLAARELAKLNPEDVDKLLDLLHAMRTND